MLSRAAMLRCLLSPPVRSACRSIRSEHTLPDLPYAYSALAPVISEEIMEIHHKKHHQTYVNNLNNVEAKVKEAQEKEDIDAIISLQPAVKFNGGGHINHCIFWQNLSPSGGGEPQGEMGGELIDAINRDFGCFDNMKERMSAATIAIQGSGWGWLGFDRRNMSLTIATCANQDPLFATTGLAPLFGIDVWEHAYYLQYKNVRPDYVKAIWNIVNWQDVAERFRNAMFQG